MYDRAANTTIMHALSVISSLQESLETCLFRLSSKTIGSPFIAHREHHGLGSRDHAVSLHRKFMHAAKRRSLLIACWESEDTYHEEHGILSANSAYQRNTTGHRRMTCPKRTNLHHPCSSRSCSFQAIDNEGFCGRYSINTTIRRTYNSKSV